MAEHILAVALRVLRQLARDRRFLALALLVPLAVVVMLKIFFDAAERPFFDPRTFAAPAGAFMAHFITYVLCIIVLVRERTAQTLARMFVSGYRRAGIIGGYLLAYSLLATLQSLIVLGTLNVLFDLAYPLRTFLAIYVVIWLLAIISIALGILVSNFARNEGQALPLIPLMVLPSVFFSGLVVPVDRLPGWASWLSLITPMYYANESIQTITGGGRPYIAAALVVYGAVVLVMATLTLREQE